MDVMAITESRAEGGMALDSILIVLDNGVLGLLVHISFLISEVHLNIREEE